jgi:hypothetical protein
MITKGSGAINPQGIQFRSPLWETKEMRTPELTDVGWLGTKDRNG